ncbi:hypothetical protein C8J57DRAFT_1277485 [Mycena rebaudengoi]|nr:hypothetical protein C8J57DRAFT_1277485 [Mycena rebaudengoi]
MIVASDDVVGLLALVYCNHQDKIIHCINTQLLMISEKPPRCLILAGQFYIVNQNKLTVDISHVHTDTSSLQTTQSPSSAVPPSIRTVAKALLSYPLFACELRSPRYDIFGVTQGAIQPDEGSDPESNSPADYVYFWPATDTGAELHLGPTCSYEHDRWIVDIRVGSSGVSAMIQYWEDREFSLGLIRYVAHLEPHNFSSA